ncbi:MAG TPA: cytochrome d ubiquinol oxidase subunit II [Clostridia bacterium]|nr:cytochrome d ubiquinol oxidase subunit II [Clostridia bacterium]
MDLSVLWFCLIGVLFCGFFFLEGFDYGSGILLPFVGKNDVERRVIFNAIGPFWDGNEVWMLTAGGAIFAAFPHWYATLFSGFYLALFLLLLALVLRGVAFEFRSKDDNPTWRAFWDWALWFGSLLPALLWGVAVANLLRGVPIDANMQFVGNFFSLLSPFTVVTGIAFVCLFTYHGALFLSMRTQGEIQQRVQNLIPRLGLATIVTVVAMAALMLLETDILGKFISIVALVLAAVALIASYVMASARRYGRAFVATALTIVFAVATVFTGLFPRVMVSSLDPAWSLTVYNASSSVTTLTIMTIVAVIFVPIVLAYQIWTYWVFRKPVDIKDLEY